MKNTVKVNFTIPQKILLFLALIETTFYLAASTINSRYGLASTGNVLHLFKFIV
jgi:hypothetical protein